MIKKFKKILFYYRGLPNSNMPMEGTSRSLLNWADYAIAKGIAKEIDVCGDYVKKSEIRNNISYLKIPSKGNENKFLAAYDIVFFFTFRGVFAKCSKRKNQIWILEQQCFEVSDFEKGKTADFDYCIAHSNAQKYQMIKQGVATEDIFVVPNICDFEKSVSELIHKRKENTIMFVGAIVPHKGLDILIKALPTIRKKRPDAELHVYGSSSMWKANGNEYEQQIRSKNVSGVFYHGAVSSDVIITEYQKYSIMCLPTQLECFPHVSIEAQNAGCIPVIHDAGGSYATMKINKTGFVYLPNTPDNVAEAVDKAFVCLERNPNMRFTAKKYAAENFFYDSVSVKMNNLFYHIDLNKKFLSECGFDVKNYLKTAKQSQSMLYDVAKKEIKKIRIICGTRSKLLKNKNTLNIYEAFSIARRLYEKNVFKISSLWLKKIISLKNIDKEIRMQSYFLLADISKDNTQNYKLLNKKAIAVLKNSKNKSIEQLYRIASLYKEKQLYLEARKIFKKILKNSTASNIKGGACFHLGEMAFFEDDSSSALLFFKKCLKYIPGHSKALNYLEKIS